MKRHLSTLISVLVLAAMVFTLASCDQLFGSNEHEHTYSDSWSSDEANHWHAATCADGDDCATATADVAAHTFDGDTCSVCGYKKASAEPNDPPAAHEHTYSTEWSKDETNHWHAATCDAEDACATATKDVAEHDFSAGNTCVCGAEHTHTYATEYSKNDTNHWYEVTCDLNDTCAAAKVEAAHDFSAGNTCVCGAEHTHTYATEYSKNDTHHWYEVTCDLNDTCAAAKVEVAHEYTNSECVCGAKHEHTYSTEWSYDEEDHWHAATCDAEDACATATKDVADHVFSNGECACGAKHEHTYSTEWSYDEENHWHAAVCDKEEACKTATKDVADHVFINNICVCGAGHDHTYSTEWSKDETNHWHAATCDATDACATATKDVADHDFSAGNTCVCDAVHTHTYATEYSKNDTHHWYAVTCAYNDTCAAAKVEAAHDFSAGNTCVCGAVHTHTYATEYSKNDTHHWYAVTCDLNDTCAATKVEAAHDFSAGNTCVCGAVHTHTYATEYSKNDTHHWYAVTCDLNDTCAAAKVEVVHEYADGECVCGAYEPGSMDNPIEITLPGELLISLEDDEILYYVFTITENKSLKFTFNTANASFGYAATAQEALDAIFDVGDNGVLEIDLAAGTYYVAYGTADFMAEDYAVTTEFVKKASKYDLEIVKGENTVYFTSDEIAADEAIRTLVITEEGNYRFASDFFMSIIDANGNEVGKTASSGYNYPLAVGTYTIKFGMLSLNTSLADVAYVVKVEKEELAEGTIDIGKVNGEDVSLTYTATEEGILAVEIINAAGGSVEIGSYTINGGNSLGYAGTSYLLYVKLKAGDTVTFNMSVDTGATATVRGYWTASTLVPDGAITDYEGEGTSTNPIVITEEGDYIIGAVNSFPGKYFTFTATENMNVTFTTDVADIYTQNWDDYDRTVTLEVKAGDTITLLTCSDYGTCDVILTVEFSEYTGEEETADTTLDIGNNSFVVEAEGITNITFTASAAGTYTVTVNTENGKISDRTGMNVGTYGTPMTILISDGDVGYAIPLLVTTTDGAAATVSITVDADIQGGGSGDNESGLVVGENAVDVTVTNGYPQTTPVTFTATVAGTYIISAAEGENNADVGIEDAYGYETITLPYTFTLGAGETVTFLVCTTNYMVTEDTIDLVITLDKEGSGEGEIITSGNIYFNEESTVTVTDELLANGKMYVLLYAYMNGEYYFESSDINVSKVMDPDGAVISVNDDGYYVLTADICYTVELDLGWIYSAGDYTITPTYVYPEGSAENPIYVFLGESTTASYDGGYLPTWYYFYANATGTLNIVTDVEHVTFIIGATASDGIESASIDVVQGRKYYIGVIGVSGTAAEIAFTASITEGEIKTDGTLNIPHNVVIGSNTASVPAWSNVWFMYKAEVAGTITFTTTSTNYAWYAVTDISEQAYSSTGDISVELYENQIIYLFVETANWAAGDVIFTASFEAAPTEIWYDNLVITDGSAANEIVLEENTYIYLSFYGNGQYTISWDNADAIIENISFGASDSSVVNGGTISAGMFGIAFNVYLPDYAAGTVNLTITPYEEPAASLAGTYTASDYWGNSFAVVIDETTITFTPPMSNEIVVTYEYADGIVTLYADGNEITNPGVMSLTIVDGVLTGMMYNMTSYTLAVEGIQGTYTAFDYWGNSFEVVIDETTITFTPPMSNEIVFTYEYADGIVTIYDTEGTEITMPYIMSLTIVDGVLTGMTYNGNDYTFGEGEDAVELVVGDNTVSASGAPTVVTFTANEANTYTITVGANALVEYDYTSYFEGETFNVTLAAGESIEFNVYTYDYSDADVVISVDIAQVSVPGEYRYSDPDNWAHRWVIVLNADGTGSIVEQNYDSDNFSWSTATSDVITYTSVANENNGYDITVDFASGAIATDGTYSVTLSGITGVVLGDVTVDFALYE